MLGDNVYSHGRECEYLLAMFRNMYEGIFRNTTAWPAPGNHDYDSDSNALTNTGPYFNIFALPKLGGSGGVASNTEAYYSYDIGNVHFIVLDSDGVSRAANGPMATWLLADLAYAKANAKWTIAYWAPSPTARVRTTPTMRARPPICGRTSIRCWNSTAWTSCSPVTAIATSAPISSMVITVSRARSTRVPWDWT
ncbi:MAG: hypothetical protein IPG92_13795 [Flavobacteriales bacterium]|nr:hypothetical protein [Flavobacteriales bacterium]